jgi:uncharacterized membrane protein
LLLDLFTWWIISISWSIAFLIVVGIYLYADSNKKRKESNQSTWNAATLVKNFTFIWILASLLVFYIISVKTGSSTLFAIGNIIVVAILIILVVKNSSKAS